MARSILVGEVRTGRRITQIPVSDASWSVVHRGPGDISIDIPLGAADFAALEAALVGLYPSDDLFMPFYPQDEVTVWRPGDGLRPEFLAALEPVRCFLAVLEGDVVLEAGPIWAWDYTDESQVLKVTAKGLWSIFDHRFIIADLASAWAEWAVTYTNLSLGTIAKRVVQLTETHEAGGLPIVLPDDEASTHDRTYKGFDMSTVRQVLEDLMGVGGGPDIAFDPRLTTDRQGVEWVMRVGSSAQPKLSQAGDDHVWDVRNPRGGVAGLSVQRDASAQVNVSYATGSGMETALMMTRREPDDAGVADLRDVGFPLLESVTARSYVKVASTLDKWADSELRGHARPWMSWVLTVSGSAAPKLGAYRPGDWARVWVGNHPLLGILLPAGFHRARIMGFSGGLDDMVQVTLAPTREAR